MQSYGFTDLIPILDNIYEKQREIKKDFKARGEDFIRKYFKQFDARPIQRFFAKHHLNKHGIMYNAALDALEEIIRKEEGNSLTQQN